MPEIPQETRRIQSLLTSLVVVILLIAILVIAIIAYPSLIEPVLSPGNLLIPSPRSTSTQTLTPTITLAPTNTRTPHPSLTPTITNTPTETLAPTATITPPGPPTLAPAQAVRNGVYSLKDWQAADAQLALDYMEDYPNTLSQEGRGENDQGYFDAFRFAILAAQEALLRYPEAEQAPDWRWDLAYNMARAGDPQAASVYAGYLVDALNHGEVQLTELSSWFEQHQSPLRLDVLGLKPPPGFIGSHLVEIHGPGSAFIWLLETPSAYQAVVLDSSFDFAGAPDMRAIASDLNGDGYEEIAFYNAGLSNAVLEKPAVFDLSAVPARKLAFRASDPGFELGAEYLNNWAVRKSPAGGNELVFRTTLFPACPITVERAYRWTGAMFEPQPANFQVQPSPTTLSMCRFLVDHAAQVWGPDGAAQIITQLLPKWPPAQDENGKPFPLDAKDEWRYRLGLYYALAGDYDKARATLADLVAKPSTPTSRWVAPAGQFLQAYRTPENVYQACLAAEFCDPQLALDQLINGLEGPTDQDMLEYLVRQGLTLRSSGYFDFDGDGQTERWFTVRHRPLEKLQAWILADAPGGVQALPVGDIENDRLNPQYLDEGAKPLVTWIEGGLFISMLRDPDTASPYLKQVFPSVELPNRFREGVQNARQALFNGGSPLDVLNMLNDLQFTPGLICKSTFSCDEYYYLLGLVNELLGNKEGAARAYVQLWSEYSRSPLTTLARLKLLGDFLRVGTPAAVSPTATFTLPAGFTPVPSPTATIDLSITPTVTPTPTETPTVTPTVTP